jgi:hypothetical protein
MRVSNPDRSPAGINRWDATPTPTGFAEIVSDYFPVLYRLGCATDYSERFVARLCSVQAVRSLSVGPH